MNDADDTAPGVEVIDCTNLVPCPPMAGPWPARHTVRCSQCKDAVELLVDRRATDTHGTSLLEERDQHDAIVQAVSHANNAEHAGMILVEGGSGADWFCDDCASVALDPLAPAVYEALRRRARWAKIKVVESPPPLSPGEPGWRGRR